MVRNKAELVIARDLVLDAILDNVFNPVVESLVALVELKLDGVDTGVVKGLRTHILVNSALDCRDLNVFKALNSLSHTLLVHLSASELLRHREWVIVAREVDVFVVSVCSEDHVLVASGNEVDLLL